MTYSTSTLLFVCLFIQIPQDFPLDKACLLGCGVPTGYGAAVNTAQVTEHTLHNAPYVTYIDEHKLERLIVHYTLLQFD